MQLDLRGLGALAVKVASCWLFGVDELHSLTLQVESDCIASRQVRIKRLVCSVCWRLVGVCEGEQRVDRYENGGNVLNFGKWEEAPKGETNKKRKREEKKRVRKRKH